MPSRLSGNRNRLHPTEHASHQKGGRLDISFTTNATSDELCASAAVALASSDKLAAKERSCSKSSVGQWTSSDKGAAKRVEKVLTKVNLARVLVQWSPLCNERAAALRPHAVLRSLTIVHRCIEAAAETRMRHAAAAHHTGLCSGAGAAGGERDEADNGRNHHRRARSCGSLPEVAAPAQSRAHFAGGSTRSALCRAARTRGMKNSAISLRVPSKDTCSSHTRASLACRPA
ncbi:hypothetical protein FGB62_383g03 [Gracilaria domingensis]|nr:hypothetical protein FGB62_383g03 [Gracilaria domingensis]